MRATRGGNSADTVYSCETAEPAAIVYRNERSTDSRGKRNPSPSGDIVTVPIRYAGRIIGGGEIPMDMECHVWRFGADGKVAAFNHVLDLEVQERAFEQRA